MTKKYHLWWPKDSFASAIQHCPYSNGCFLLLISILAFFAFDQKFIWLRSLSCQFMMAPVPWASLAGKRSFVIVDEACGHPWARWRDGGARLWVSGAGCPARNGGKPVSPQGCSLKSFSQWRVSISCWFCPAERGIHVTERWTWTASH